MLEIIGQLYTTVLYQPIYNLVILLYNFSPGPNLGWAIVILALIVRVFFLIFTLRGFKTDELLEEITPTIRAVETDNNLDSKQKRDKITALLKSKGINPMSEIYALLGQLLFIFVLYQIVQNGLHPPFSGLYSWVRAPENVDTIFFGFDVAQRSLPLSLIAAGILFVEQLWEYEAKKDIAETNFSGRWYPLLLPLSTFILLLFLPATKAVFIAVSVLFSIGIRIMITLARQGKS